MAKKTVSTIAMTVIIITFISIFSWLIVSGVEDLLSDSLNVKAKIIIGVIGLSIAAVVGWLKLR